MDRNQMLEIVESIDEQYGVELDFSDISPSDYHELTAEEFRQEAVKGAKVLRKRQGLPPLKEEAEPSPEAEEVDISKITDVDTLYEMWLDQGRPVAGPGDQREAAARKAEKRDALRARLAQAHENDYLAKRKKKLRKLRGRKRAEERRKAAASK